MLMSCGSESWISFKIIWGLPFIFRKIEIKSIMFSYVIQSSFMGATWSHKIQSVNFCVDVPHHVTSRSVKLLAELKENNGQTNIYRDFSRRSIIFLNVSKDSSSRDTGFLLRIHLFIYSHFRITPMYLRII
jgi:hypothetical protein